MSDESELSEIQKVCRALKRYYQSLNKGDEYVNEDGVGKFEAYCDDNGVEELDDELEDNEAEDCLLCDFDEDFPFKDEPDDQKLFIYNLIKSCKANPDIDFSFSLPQINQNLIDEIDQSDVEKIKEIYKTQCASIYNQGMEEDGSLCTLLAIQKKLNDKGYHIDYLQLLVDSYDRFRVKNQKQKKSPKDWVMGDGQILFKGGLQNLSITVPSSNGGGKGVAKYPLFASSCISSYNKRCCDKLLLNSNYKIRDSMEETVAIINAAIDFIANATLKTKALLPFQFDVCIAVGAPKDTAANPVDDESEDDEPDEDDNKQDFVDYIGDVEKIKKKLKNNGLKYIHSKTGDEFKDGRYVGELIQNFKTKHGVNDDEKGNYLRDNRIIALIDSRKSKLNKDEKGKPDVFLYEPPSGPYTRNIPKGAMPEWYISSTRTCLLPPMKYDEEKAIAKGNIFEDDGKPDEDINIGAAFHCKGALLTCSFHVREADVIKCYLYYNGQIIRFFPDDIKDLLPLLFDPDACGNKEYIEKVKKGDLNKLIQEMSDKLPDKQYKAWAATYINV